MDRTEKAIREEARELAGLTFEQQFATWKPEEINENSLLVERMLRLPNPDSAWVEFAHMLGRFELTIGESYRALQNRVNNSLQLLMVLTGAKTEMQILEYTQRLKKVEKNLPSIVKQLATGIVGGQIGAQSQFPGGFSIPPLPTTTTPSQNPTYHVYPWNMAAKQNAALAPQKCSGILLSGDGAQIASFIDNASGIAVEVDTAAKTVMVALNGQFVENIDDDLMTALSIGDELLPVPIKVNGRYFVTPAEALASGVGVGTQVKTIGRVVKNDEDERTIQVVDRSFYPLPPA